MSFTAIILAAAKSAGVSGALLLAVCTHESNLTNTLVLEDGGSPTYGICQVKEVSAKSMGFKGDPKLLMNPEVNAKYAALYLKYQLGRYGNDECKAVSAYNMGSYRESQKRPGQPLNIGYIRNIQAKTSAVLFKNTGCALTEIAQTR